MPALDILRPRHGLPVDARLCHCGSGYLLESRVANAAIRVRDQEVVLDGLLVPGSPRVSLVLQQMLVHGAKSGRVLLEFVVRLGRLKLAEAAGQECPRVLRFIVLQSNSLLSL